MIDNKLTSYISVISKGSLVAVDDYIGDAQDELIYKLIASITPQSKDKMSNKFTKRLISRLKLINEVVRKKLDNYYYELKQYRQGEFIIIVYKLAGPKVVTTE